nr:RNA ligase (ATP) [Neorhizobium tomejilense]
MVEIDTIEPHPDADAIEVAMIQRYRSVVRKSSGFKAGDKVAYIPQSSIVPEYLMRRLGLWDEERGVGRLGGVNSDRVSATKFRGLLSQGICLPLSKWGNDDSVVWVEGEKDLRPARVGDDLAEFLGVKKWSPPIPPELQGEIFNVGQELVVDFDIEDVKAYPDAMIPGEEVEYTEKLHGVFTGVTVVPLSEAKAAGITEFGFGPDRNIVIYSKGLGAQGKSFKNSDKNSSSVYMKSTAGLVEKLHSFAVGIKEPLTILGETFGPRVQDLHYGKELGFRMFGACSGYRGRHDFFGPDRRAEIASVVGVEQVPRFYRGPFSWESLAEHTDGKTALGANHIREGVVVTPVVQRSHSRIGRVIVKSVSEKYLLRSGGTEYS